MKAAACAIVLLACGARSELDAPHADAATDDAMTSGVLETIIVPTDGSSVSSKTELSAGVVYELRASGTFVMGGPGDRLGDAEYEDFADAPSSAIDCYPVASSCVDVGIGIDDNVDDAMKSPHWGSYAPTHVYTIDFTGHGATIALSYHDNYYPDNVGTLTVTIGLP